MVKPPKKAKRGRPEAPLVILDPQAVLKRLFEGGDKAPSKAKKGRRKAKPVPAGKRK